MDDWLLNLPIPWMAVVIFAATYLIAACVYLLVVRPVRRIASIADQLSMGHATAGDFPPGRGPELTALTRSFNRMRTSLEKAMKMLEPK